MLIVVAISLAIGFALGYFYIKPGITAIEDTYRAELETGSLRLLVTKRFGYRSLLTLKGKIPEPGPVLPGFLFNPYTFGISL
jgi:hypothetical protein